MLQPVMQDMLATHCVALEGGFLGLKELDSCYIYCVMFYWEIYGVLAI